MNFYSKLCSKLRLSVCVSELFMGSCTSGLMLTFMRRTQFGAFTSTHCQRHTLDLMPFYWYKLWINGEAHSQFGQSFFFLLSFFALFATNSRSGSITRRVKHKQVTNMCIFSLWIRITKNLEHTHTRKKNWWNKMCVPMKSNFSSTDVGQARKFK